MAPKPHNMYGVRNHGWPQNLQNVYAFWSNGWPQKLFKFIESVEPWMAQNLTHLYGFEPWMAPKPYRFIRFGTMHGPKTL